MPALLDRPATRKVVPSGAKAHDPAHGSGHKAPTDRTNPTISGLLLHTGRRKDLEVVGPLVGRRVMPAAPSEPG
jgi:hypothetical protein